VVLSDLSFIKISLHLSLSYIVMTPSCNAIFG
jgi:hypothetical protein